MVMRVASRSAATSPQSPPRERILRAARDLFYRHGIRAVGVDAIAAAAGTNKMTLYRHFPSKDELVAECLRELAGEKEAAWDALSHTHKGDPEGELNAWLEKVGEFVSKTNERGCGLANAAVELPEKDHPARRVIEEHKKRSRERLARLCREAGYTDPEGLADEIRLLLEGARICLQSVGPAGPGARFVSMARALLLERARRTERSPA